MTHRLLRMVAPSTLPQAGPLAHHGRMVLGLAMLVIALSGCSLVGIATAPARTVSVSADQIASAMQGDHFYSDYRNATLVVSGTVTAVTSDGGDTVLELATSIPTKVRCDIGTARTSIRVGAAVTVTSSDGERVPSAVLLRDCRPG